MGYALTRHWKELYGEGTRVRRESIEGGETYADTEQRARTWWAATAAGAGCVEASAQVEILDATGRTVACVRDSGSGTPALAPAGEDGPATMRWLNHLREAGILAERVRLSTERLSVLGSGDLAGEAAGEMLDAAASRLVALVFRLDEMLSRSWSASGGDPVRRLVARRTVEETMDGADTDGVLALAMNNRIPVPPSSLPPEKVPAVLEALRRVSAAALTACEVIEGHASGVEPEPAAVPGR